MTLHSPAYRERLPAAIFPTTGALLLLCGGFADPARAQLAYCGAGDPFVAGVVGGCIAKSLAEQVGAGHGDIYTPGSSTYLIKRDPARSVRRGRQLFQRKFSVEEGLGPRVNASSSGDISMQRALGAGLSDSCAACHGRPRGSAGFGGDVVTRPDSRDAPHLFGLGLVEQLADEMTQTLRRQRRRAMYLARRQGKCVRHAMQAKGVEFGELTACPDGKIHTARVEGVDADLRVRPFFHHGATASIREFVIGALNDEMGLQAWDPVLCAVTDPVTPIPMESPSGFSYDPNLDRFERPKACNSISDPDGDGVSGEIDPALVDHLEFYLLNYFKPGQYEVTQRTREGDALMDTIGCTSCHRRELRIRADRRIADVDTRFDPERGIFNSLYATARTQFTEMDDGEPHPQLLPKREPFVVRNFFSDLKRHDLGPAFHERDFDGTVQKEFVTEPLWGVGSTAPYGHDGRSINLDAVIRRHGGEAQRSRDAYVKLSVTRQRKIVEFLESLVLFPPDDTASNLDPGDPLNSDHIQDPSVHGSISLGVLFQILEEGAE